MKTVDEAGVRKSQEVPRNSEQKIITTTADLISNLTPPPLPPFPPRIVAHSPPSLRLSSHFTEYFSMQGGPGQGSKA